MLDAASPHGTPSEDLQADRRPVLKRFLLCFLLVVTVTYALGVNPYWRFQRDSALYMGLGRSMAETGTYEFNYRPHTLALPGFPAMLSVIYRTWGQNFLAMNILVSLFGLASIAAGYLVLSELPLKRGQIVAAMLLFGLSRTLYYYSTHIMTDVPFTFFVLVALYCGQRMLRGTGKAAWWWCVGAGVATCAASCVRPFGPAVAAGLAAALWVRPGGLKAWKANAAKTLIVTVPVALAMAAWSAYCTHVTTAATGTYIQRMVVRRGARSVVADAMEQVAPFVDAVPDALLGTGMGYTAAAFLLILMAIGLFVAVKRREVLLTVYAAVYTGGLFIGQPGRRYLLPLLPIMVYWLLEGASVVGGWIAGRQRIVWLPITVFWCVMGVRSYMGLSFLWSTLALVGSALVWLGIGWWLFRGGSGAPARRRVLRLGYVLLGLAVATNVIRIAKVVQEARARDFYATIEDGRLVDYFAVTDWLKEHAGSEDAVLTYEARTVHYFSRLRTVRFSRHWPRDGGQETARVLRATGIRYFVRDPKDRALPFIDRLVETYPQAFETVGHFGKLTLLRVIPERLRGGET